MTANLTLSASEVAENYAISVSSGAIVANKFIKLACKRFLKDLTDGRKRGFYFDEGMAQRAVDFFGFLKHSKGEWGAYAGHEAETFSLADWQVFITANLFGWYREDGTRRFREAHIEIGRGNGKTTLLAGYGLYLLFADNEPGAEIYCAATKEKQARQLFEEAVRMREASPALIKRISVSGKQKKSCLFVQTTNSKFEPVSSEDKTQDGLNIHGLLIDELHAHPTRKLYDVLKEATAKRRQPLTLVITTAGDADPESIYAKQREFAECILEETLADDTFFAYIACADDPNNWDDENEWRKANPNIGISPKIDYLRTEAAKCKVDPSALNAFLKKHLNVITSADNAWMAPEVWKQCQADMRSNPIEQRRRALETLKGRPCAAGLDLSSVEDVTSLVLVFPPVETTGTWAVLPYFWIPEATVPVRTKKSNIPYEQWVKDGFIEVTPGKAIRSDFIQAKIVELNKTYNIAKLGYDRWGAKELVARLIEDGLKVEDFGQGTKSMNEPMKKVMALALEQRVEHYGNPVLKWMMKNVIATRDPAGFIKPDKEKSKEKIDGPVAMIMAVGEIIGGPIDTTFVYNERGIRFMDPEHDWAEEIAKDVTSKPKSTEVQAATLTRPPVAPFVRRVRVLLTATGEERIITREEYISQAVLNWFQRGDMKFLNIEE